MTKDEFKDQFPEELADTIYCRIFSHNKSQGKNHDDPQFIDEEDMMSTAFNNLCDKLADLAFEGTDLEQ